MNFLAHIYLSGKNEPLMIGNFIADHVKGTAFQKLPPDIQSGVSLHRKIDSFTDSHPIVDQSKIRLRPIFRKYAPVIADIFYDHFLATHWKQYHPEPLEKFSKEFYLAIEKYSDVIPERTSNMLSYMIPGNWLYNYRTIEGIDKVMNGMARRTTFNSGMENASTELVRHYNDYENEFTIFFEDLIEFTQSQPESEGIQIR